MLKLPDQPYRITAVLLGDRRVLMRWKPGHPPEYQVPIGDAVIWQTLAQIAQGGP